MALSLVYSLFVLLLYPLFTKYRCILITGVLTVFCFLQMTVVCAVIHLQFWALGPGTRYIQYQ